MGRRAHPWQRNGKGPWWMNEGKTQINLGYDKEEAEREFHRRKAARKEAIKRGMTVEGLADHFHDFLVRECEPETAAWYVRHLKSLMKHVGHDTAAAEIRPHHITGWLAAHPSWGATTRNLMIVVAKRLYAWGKKQGHIAENPIKEMDKPTPDKRRKILTDAQASNIIESTRCPAFKDFLIALRETGCRPIEIYTLTADQIDLASGIWRVRNKTRRKTGEPLRTIYLNARMVEMSRRLLGENPQGILFLNSHGKPWNRKAIIRRFERFREKSKMGSEAVAYSFRHLYITDALERGIPPATVAELVGHTSLEMIMKIYNQLKHRTDHLREAAQMIRPA